MASSIRSCVVVALALAGCGQQRLVPVEGIVTLDGQTLGYQNLRFVPEPGTPGGGAAAETDADGKYSLITIVPESDSMLRTGVPPGRYRVTVYEVPRWPAVRRRRTIPAVYTSETSTPIVLEVPQSGGVLNIDLTSTEEVAGERP